MPDCRPKMNCVILPPFTTLSLTPFPQRFYRKCSVPDRNLGGSARPRGIFSRCGENLATNNGFNTNVPAQPPTHLQPDFARPDLVLDSPSSIPVQQRNHQQYPSRPYTNQSRLRHLHRELIILIISPIPPPLRLGSHWDSPPHVHNCSWGHPPQLDH